MVGIGMRETSIGLVLIFLLDDSKQSLSKIVRNNISASSLHRVEGIARESLTRVNEPRGIRLHARSGTINAPPPPILKFRTVEPSGPHFPLGSSPQIRDRLISAARSAADNTVHTTAIHGSQRVAAIKG